VPNYEFSCEPCNIYWEKIRPLSESGKGSMCPKCRKKGVRNYGVAHINYPAGSRERQHMHEKYIAGGDKGRALGKQKALVERTKARQKEVPYTPMIPNTQEMEEKGLITRNNDIRASKKRENMKKITRHVYNKAKKDPTKPTNSRQTL